MKLILASTSPRRQELLKELKIPFEVVAPLFEEVPTNRSARDEALYFAEQKARSIAKSHPNSLIIGSDTLVDLEGKKIGKASNANEARVILQKLTGKKHKVFTAVVLFNTKENSFQSHVEEASVTFHSLSNEEIENYIATGEPIGKAGAYAIQGKGKSLISHIEGNRQGVIGLPLNPIRRWLNQKTNS